MSAVETNQPQESNTGETFVECEFMARVNGEVLHEIPPDLFIPPDALEVILERFEGPLDLLLYLIKKHQLDILDIPIAEITRQYIEYIDMMRALRFDLAAEYLVMAAMLAEIKSRLLLPRPVTDTEDEGDPRAELVRRLQEYERFKQAAENLDELPREGRDFFLCTAEAPAGEVDKPLPEVQLRELLAAMRDVMQRASLNESHHIEQETLSVRERMTEMLGRLSSTEFCDFSDLFDYKEGRLGLAVSFIALLELMRQSLVEIIQHEPFTPIHLKKVS